MLKPATKLAGIYKPADTHLGELVGINQPLSARYVALASVQIETDYFQVSGN